MRGTIYKSTGNLYHTKDTSGEWWACKLRGKYKIDDDITSSNPIAVGDEVVFEIEDHASRSGVITDIKERNNYIVRTSPQNRKHQKHIIAANISQAIVVATISSPKTSFGFIDRFLITAEAYHIPATVLFNKSDLLVNEHYEEWDYKRTIYELAGYPVLTISAINEQDVLSLFPLLKDKTTLLAGHSGAGKSTIINLLHPDRGQKVQDVSEWSGKGKHTTTFAEMMDLPFGGRIIDTPGVKEFGIVDMEREELAHYFPEMRARAEGCKFNNCMHINEPGCAIKAAVSAHSISEERYESYINILMSLPGQNYQK